MFFTEHDLYRPADWRYRRADWLRANGRYTRKNKDDRYVALARRYLVQREKCQDVYAEERLANQMPGLYYAHKIYLRTETDDRWTIEARILADQPVNLIARKQHTTPEVIWWYEKLFFDVRDKLQSRDYIINRVLGPAVHRGINERDFDLLLKLYALLGGPLVVDALVSMSMLTGAKPQNEQELEAYFKRDTADCVRRKASLAARCVPINSHTQMTLLDTHHKLLALEQAKDDGIDATNQIITSLQTTLANIPFHAAKERPSLPALQGYDKLSVELRADELIRAGTGEELNLKEELTLFQFPQEESHG